MNVCFREVPVRDLCRAVISIQVPWCSGSFLIKGALCSAMGNSAGCGEMEEGSETLPLLNQCLI